MEKILFRGKRIDNNEWIYGDLIHRFDFDGKYDDEYGNISIKPIGNEEHDVDPKTIGQLWIKSGIRFFGGDLLKAVCSPSKLNKNKKKERICKVIDSDTGFDIAIWYKKEWWSYSYFDFTTSKIIGNIYENTEFLK